MNNIVHSERLLHSKTKSKTKIFFQSLQHMSYDQADRHARIGSYSFILACPNPMIHYYKS